MLFIRVQLTVSHIFLELIFIFQFVSFFRLFIRIGFFHMNRFSDTYRFFETYLFSIRIGFFLIRIVFQYVSVFWYVSIDQYVSIFICLYLLDRSESDQLPTKIPIFLLYRIRWYQLQTVFLLYGIGIKNNDIIRPVQ